MIAQLEDVLDRAETWPGWAWQDLADLAMEIDCEINTGTCGITREELRKIDRAVRPTGRRKEMKCRS